MTRREAVNKFFRLKQSEKNELLEKMGLQAASTFDEYKAQLMLIKDWSAFIKEVGNA